MKKVVFPVQKGGFCVKKVVFFCCIFFVCGLEGGLPPWEATSGSNPEGGKTTFCSQKNGCIPPFRESIVLAWKRYKNAKYKRWFSVVNVVVLPPSAEELQRWFLRW